MSANAPDALDLGYFEDDAPEPTAPTSDDGQDEDILPDVTLEVLNELSAAEPSAGDKIDVIMADAKLAAMKPKPMLNEMIVEICDAANRLEDGQRALMRAGAAAEPHGPYMRKAAILDAAQRLLVLIEARGDAVKRVLRG